MFKRFKIFMGDGSFHPHRQSSLSAGIDVSYKQGENIIIKPGNRALIPTGIFVQLPRGYEIQVRPRSGLALKHGITVLNSPGTIDADYRGEIGVILINHGLQSFKVRPGDRIGQLVVSKYKVPRWNIVKNISDLTQTERGDGGFGSTDK